MNQTFLSRQDRVDFQKLRVLGDPVGRGLGYGESYLVVLGGSRSPRIQAEQWPPKMSCNSWTVDSCVHWKMEHR